MPEPTPSNLTPTEWAVMKIVWQLGRGAARDIYGIASAEHDIPVNTVKTTLRRLVEKGHLATTQVGNCFVYEPTRSRLGTLCAAADRLLEHLDAGAGRVLAHMLKHSRVTPGEVAELRQLLDQLAPDDESNDGGGEGRS